MKISKLNPSKHHLGMTAKSFALTAHRWAKELKEGTNQSDPDWDLKTSLLDGNYGAAYVMLPGINESYAAFSSLNTEEELQIVDSPDNIVGLSSNPSFEVKNVNRRNEESSSPTNGFYPRYFDSEAKILEKINEGLTFIEDSDQLSGEIHIYTEIEPCVSCEFVTEQFMSKFPKIDIYYYYDKSSSTNKRKRRTQNYVQP